jgi:hypothetical protein
MYTRDFPMKIFFYQSNFRIGTFYRSGTMNAAAADGASCAADQ